MENRITTLFFKIVGLGLILCSAEIFAETQEESLMLEVIDPYIELHTGPGKGYPIFYTIEQGETITVITRRTGWYEIRSSNGKIGWAKASQVARTLLPTGEPVDLPTVSYGDYLKNNWRVGFNVGQFTSGELEGTDVFGYSVGYRPFSFLGLEVEQGNFYETEISGSYQSFNIILEPYTEWVVSPLLLIGQGSIKIESQPELTPLSFEKDSFSRVGLGINYYIGRNFVLQAGVQDFTISTDNNDERVKRWNIGFNAFF